MNKLILSLAVIGSITLIRCNKQECHPCHYDTPTGQVDLGEKCDDELEDLEANGYTENGTTYTVHCHEH